MKKYLKITLLVVVAAIFIGTFIFLYQKSKPKTTVYETITPEIADLEKTTVATGKVEPRDEVLIKPQISGIISEVYKEAGQTIKQGEVIAKVKVIPELGQLNSAESRVRVAEISTAQAETDHERIKKLYNDKFRYFGIGIHHTGYTIVIHTVFHSQDMIDSNFTFTNGSMCQHNFQAIAS